MEIMDDLFKIKVEYTEKLIIYFLKEYKIKKHIKSLDYAMKVIKSNMHEIVNAYYVFDETI